MKGVGLMIDIPPEKAQEILDAKEDIDTARDEASEHDLSFDGVNDDELIECREALRNRAQRIMACLHKYAEWKEA